jgi:methylated-DNA-protein-cysteine methyltransferase-like protein
MTSRDRHPSFFERTYHIVRMIPYGQVATYGQVAEIVSDRRAARTVGWALNALRRGTDVPWHRVINARGTISRRNRERAAQTQQQLLQREGIAFDAQGRIDLQEFQWDGLTWPEIESLHREWNTNPPER